MNKREAAIVSAYTGILIGEFSDMHGYIEEIIGDPVFTHQMADRLFSKHIKELSRQDFINIEVRD